MADAYQLLSYSKIRHPTRYHQERNIPIILPTAIGYFCKNCRFRIQPAIISPPLLSAAGDLNYPYAKVGAALSQNMINSFRIKIWRRAKPKFDFTFSSKLRELLINPLLRNEAVVYRLCLLPSVHAALPARMPFGCQSASTQYNPGH